MKSPGASGVVYIEICLVLWTGPSDRGAYWAVKPVPKGEGDRDGDSR